MFVAVPVAVAVGVLVVVRVGRAVPEVDAVGERLTRVDELAI